MFKDYDGLIAQKQNEIETLEEERREFFQKKPDEKIAQVLPELRTVCSLSSDEALRRAQAMLKITNFQTIEQLLKALLGKHKKDTL